MIYEIYDYIIIQAQSTIWTISILSSLRRLVLVIFRSLEMDVLNLKSNYNIHCSADCDDLLLLVLNDSLNWSLPTAFLILLMTFPLQTRTMNTKKP